MKLKALIIVIFSVFLTLPALSQETISREKFEECQCQFDKEPQKEIPCEDTKKTETVSAYFVEDMDPWADRNQRTECGNGCYVPAGTPVIEGCGKFWHEDCHNLFKEVRKVTIAGRSDDLDTERPLQRQQSQQQSGKGAQVIVLDRQSSNQQQECCGLEDYKDGLEDGRRGTRQDVRLGADIAQESFENASEQRTVVLNGQQQQMPVARQTPPQYQPTSGSDQPPQRRPQGRDVVYMRDRRGGWFGTFAREVGAAALGNAMWDGTKWVIRNVAENQRHKHRTPPTTNQGQNDFGNGGDPGGGNFNDYGSNEDWGRLKDP